MHVCDPNLPVLHFQSHPCRLELCWETLSVAQACWLELCKNVLHYGAFPGIQLGM